MQWKHVDFGRGMIQVRQRFYRGDLDVVKSERSHRDVPMGLLATDLATLYPGPEHAEEYVFGVRTHVGREKKGRVCLIAPVLRGLPLIHERRHFVTVVR